MHSIGSYEDKVDFLTSASVLKAALLKAAVQQTQSITVDYTALIQWVQVIGNTTLG